VWSTVLVMGLIAACDPVRVGIALLLISRPQPMLNLLAYWLGGLVAASTAAVGTLLVLRTVAPMLTKQVTAVAQSPVVRNFQVAAGLAAVLIAALIGVGFSVRQRTRVSMSGGGPTTLLRRPETASAISRLSARGRNALDGNFFWVALVAGVVSAVPPVEYLVVITVILSSGTATGTQISAAMLFTVVSLVFFEIPLLSSWATPARTQAVMLHLHDWAHARRRVILTIGVAVVGVFLVATGMSSA
jgi:hypothetical protein